MMRSGRIKYCSWVLAVLALLQINASAQTSNAGFAGRVRDESGASIAGALVRLVSSSGIVQTKTSEDGTFSFKDPVGAGTLTIDAPGFAVFSLEISATRQTNVEVVLRPTSIREQVTITATRTETPLGSTAASVRLISPRELATSGALAIDDVLRQVPGFQLFRRSGSRTANPTSQGVSLRGVGASGASRALVLADGIPFADPFGGWVYWDRMPRAAVNLVEVVRGGTSDLYGSSAMGGVINILTRPNDGPALSFESSYGNQNTAAASVYAAGRIRKFTTSAAGELFETDGYINVRKNDRGVVDTPVSSSHRSFYFEIGYNPTKNSRLFLRPSYFTESRNNGTPQQTNQTRIREIDGGANWSLHRIGELSLRGYLSTQIYDQVFSAIDASRNTETLTRIQRVPAQAEGLTFQWSGSIGDRQNLVAGVEAREVRGSSDEIAYVGGSPSSLIGAGGRQHSVAFFLRDTVQLASKFSISGGARIDSFKNFAGLSVSRGLSPGSREQVTQFADLSEIAVSPQFSALYHANKKVSFFASFNNAFRAPTLNELYRSFRVGNVLTLANEKLKRERATGGEVGTALSLWEDRLSLRANFFATSINDPIANVTLVTSPTLITRQRQNLGRTRTLGLEVDATLRLRRGWNINTGYLGSDSKVISFSANPLLEGLLIPQTPRHTFTFQISYAGSKQYKFGLQGRASGSQFDDDQNLLPLRKFFTLDAYFSRLINRKLEVFVAGENLLNSRYEVGRTPVTTIGPPIFVRAGVKVNFRKENHRE